MRRLENDGAHISMSEQEKEILNNHGNTEMCEARKDLQWAIVNDVTGRRLDRSNPDDGQTFKDAWDSIQQTERAKKIVEE